MSEDKAKRTMHVIIPAEATDEEVDRFEDAVADVAMGFKFSEPCDSFVSSHGGECDDDPHCGGANPWRQRALAAEAQLRPMRFRVRDRLVVLASRANRRWFT